MPFLFSEMHFPGELKSNTLVLLAFRTRLRTRPRRRSSQPSVRNPTRNQQSALARRNAPGQARATREIPDRKGRFTTRPAVATFATESEWWCEEPRRGC